jgi:hypothetical protein
VQSICETVTYIKVKELEAVSAFSRDLKFAEEQKGDILCIYCDGELFKEFIYIHKCMRL